MLGELNEPYHYILREISLKGLLIGQAVVLPINAKQEAVGAAPCGAVPREKCPGETVLKDDRIFQGVACCTRSLQEYCSFNTHSG